MDTIDDIQISFNHINMHLLQVTILAILLLLLLIILVLLPDKCILKPDNSDNSNSLDTIDDIQMSFFIILTCIYYMLLY